MILTLIIFSCITELLVYLFWRSKLRAKLALVTLFLLAASLISIILLGFDGWDLAISIAILWRMVNIMRILLQRYESKRLWMITRRSSLWFVSVQIILMLCAYTLETYISASVLIWVWLGAQIITAIGIWATTWRTITKSRFRPDNIHYADRDLPSVSICIAARDETSMLEDCLRSIIASDYPKLEIIVLDDSSHDSTPEIIKNFAHDGVRFVQGSEPDDHWLAKNLAYQRLSEEASGEILLYCGVDIRMQRESIRRLVTAMQLRKKDMICILPQRFHDSIAGAFIQPMRYWWELALPRRLFNRPPVLSSCWLIRKTALKQIGGFASFGRSIIPELPIAQHCARTDAYSFIRSDAFLGVQTQKSVAAQRATMIRIRYPQIHKKLELAAALIVAEITLLIGPFITCIIGIVTSDATIIFTSAIAGLFLIVTHIHITMISSPPSVPISIVNFPVAVIAELALSIVSLVRYEFKSVTWKGRTIAPRQLEVIKQLPQLPSN